MEIYQSHKIVKASAKCSEIRRSPAPSEGFFNLTDDVGETLTVKDNFFARGEPHGAFYIVEYKDGYRSFSPPDAFESGYTKMSGLAEAAAMDLRRACFGMTSHNMTIADRIVCALRIADFVKNGKDSSSAVK